MKKKTKLPKTKAACEALCRELVAERNALFASWCKRVKAGKNPTPAMIAQRAELVLRVTELHLHALACKF